MLFVLDLVLVFLILFSFSLFVELDVRSFGSPSSPDKVAEKDTAHEVRGTVRSRLADKPSDKGLVKVRADRVTHGHRRFARVARPRRVNRPGVSGDSKS